MPKLTKHFLDSTFLSPVINCYGCYKENCYKENERIFKTAEHSTKVRIELTKVLERYSLREDDDPCKQLIEKAFSICNSCNYLSPRIVDLVKKTMEEGGYIKC